MRTPMWVAPLFAIAFLAAPAGAGSSEIVFTKVADSETLSSDGWSIEPYWDDESLGRRHLYPAAHVAMDDEGNLAFAASARMDTGGQFPLQENHFVAIVGGEVHRLNSRMAGDFGQIHIEEGRVTFGDQDERGGIFRWEAGTLEEVVVTGTPVPEGGGAVFEARDPDEGGVSNRPFVVDGGAVLFQTPGFGWLWRNGSIELIGSQASIDDGLIAFVGRDGALYARQPEGVPRRIVGPGDPIPGRGAVFDEVMGPAVVGGRIAFMGRDEAGTSGVYLWEGGALTTLAEDGMPLPGGRSLNFDRWYYQPFRLGADRVVVLGRDAQGSLLYLASLDRGWSKVFDESDLGFFYGDGLGDFDRNQLVLESGSGVHVLRADGSSVRVLEDVSHVGDLRKDKLALGVELHDPIERTFSRQIYVAELPPLSVGIDVRPGGRTNRIYPHSRRPKRVALLGSETFYVEDIDVSTLGLGPSAAPPVGEPKLRDVNGDGWDDLVLRFRPRETGIEPGASELCLSGETLDGIGFEGCDAIRTKGRARRAPAR